jgi:hypothetical protein
MNTNKLLMAVAAVALIAGTGGALAQQEPHSPAAEQVAPKTPAPIKGPNANLVFDTSPESHARIRTIFGKERSALKVNHVNFSLAPGTVVPRSVRLAALPQTIIEIQPTWHGDEYFMVRNKIVIVDPQSMAIVGVFRI